MSILLQELAVANIKAQRRDPLAHADHDTHVQRWRDHQFMLNAALSGGHDEKLVKDYLEWLAGKVWSLRRW